MRRTDDLLDLCGRLARDGRTATVIPGHGAIAGPEAVVAQRAYFDRLYAAVSNAREAGRSRTEAVRLKPPGLPAERAQLLATNVGLVFDELDRIPDERRKISCQPE
jgi:hypothetical protein